MQGSCFHLSPTTLTLFYHNSQRPPKLRHVSKKFHIVIRHAVCWWNDPTSYFPPCCSRFFSDMPQFGLSSTNSHWGYGAAGAYSPYFTPSTLGSCAAPTASQFNTPALGFSGATPDQSSTQDAFGSTSNVSSCEYVEMFFFLL